MHRSICECRPDWQELKQAYNESQEAWELRISALFDFVSDQSRVRKHATPRPKAAPAPRFSILEGPEGGLRDAAEQKDRFGLPGHDSATTGLHEVVQDQVQDAVQNRADTCAAAQQDQAPARATLGDSQGGQPFNPGRQPLNLHVAVVLLAGVLFLP